MTVEMVIILKSTWAASHGKRSALAVRDARAHTLISKETFLFSAHRAPFCSRCFFPCVCECATKKRTKARRMFNCLWNLNGEITQLLKCHVCAGSFVLFCTLTISSVCPILLSFILSLVSSLCSWWSVGRAVCRCTVKRSRRPAPTRLWSCSGWRVYRKRD